MPVKQTLGDLAVRALTQGVQCDEATRAVLGQTVEISLNPRWSLPVALVDSAEVTLTLSGMSPTLDLGDESHPVSIIREPGYLKEKTPSGQERRALAKTFANFLLFHPLHLAADGAERRVEICPPGVKGSVSLSFEDVSDVVAAALRHEETDCIAFRWEQRLTAGEVDQAMGPLLQMIRRNFDVLIAVECPPPRSGHIMELLYAWGVDAIALPAVGLSPDLENRPAPLGETIQSLERAVNVFTRGTVIASVDIGAESMENTKTSISRLAQMGVRVALQQSPGHTPWSGEQLRTLWMHLSRDLSRSRLASPWTPHPLAEATFVPSQAFDPNASSAPFGGGFWKTRPGQSIARNLIRLRRRLRVRRVDASLESSEL